MARYSDTLDDQYGRPIGGALVYVTDSTTAALVPLTDDGGAALPNPLTTPATGVVVFNVNGGIFDLSYWYGGRLVREDFGVNIGGGASLPPGSVANSLGTSTTIAPSQNAVTVGFAADSGAGLVGYSTASTYPAGTIGNYLQTYNTLNRTISYTGTFALTNLGTTSPPNISVIAVGGNSVAFTTRISTPSGAPDTDNQRATALFASTTSDDGNSEEQTVCVLTTIQTGFSKTWAISTAFLVGDNVRTNGNVYRCVTAGTSAATGTGPSGKALGITDGTVVWNWINDSAIDAKVGIYNEVEVKPGAGSSWAQANNIQIDAGVTTPFVVNTEFDLTNNCGTDSVFGGLNKYNLYLANQGASKSTSVIEISSANTSNASALWGIHLSGTKLASNSVLGIDASSAVGIGFGTSANGATNPTYTDSVIKDGGATAVNGISLGGTYSGAGMQVTGSAPAAFVSGGTKSVAGFWDLSTAPIGLKLNGTYSQTPLQFATLPGNFANDAAASSGGVPVGGVYRNGSVIQIRVT